MKKRILSAFLAFCVLLALCPATTRAATIVASGPCGAENEADLIWTLDENGRMTFVGSGAMKDYSIWRNSGNSALTSAPWLSYRDKIKSVIIPSGVTHVGSYAFFGSYYCYFSPASVTMADSVESIGEGAFEYCRCSNITLSNALTSIPANAFRDCYDLREITIPSGVTEIGDNAFYGCSWIAYSIQLPDGLTTLGKYAFYGCSELETLTIPGGVTEIGDDAFSKCDKLTLTVYNGSFAQRYCLLHSIRHNAINPDTYTITFHPNGGKAPQTTKTLTSIDTVYGELPTPTRDGYAFMGWHTATEYGDKITPETEFAPRQDQTLYAVWSKMYAITFDPNGGEVSQTSKTLTDDDTAYGELPTPTRDGYTFEGWRTEPDGGTLITETAPFEPKGNQTLYAVWAEIKETYEVTLKANGGSVEPSSVTVEEGGVYGALPEPSRNGCAFLGWFTEPSGGTQVTAETEVRLTDNQSLYAHWVATNAPEFSSNGAAVTDVREMPAETDLEGKFTVPDAADPDAFRTATAFCVLYDSAGLMVHLQSWEVDVSDTRNIRFTGSVRIPEGAQVSEIKIIVLSDELVPLQAAGTL